MSDKEVGRAGVLARVEAGELTQVEAAEKLRVSYRQLKRLYKRFKCAGAAGLKHGNAGRRSNAAKPDDDRQRVLELVREHYSGPPGERFGPTLAAEHLETDHSIAVDAETLRRWMLAAGLWSRERRRRRHRKRRARREHFGELLQLDGSFHRWLEQRGPQGCLLNLVDDATGTALLRFTDDETTWGIADLLRAWIERYGIPRALYTDWKSVYHPPVKDTDELERPLSQFGRMCAQLGIELIAANSPQAKGRVERAHATHQDRMVKKLRLLEVDSYEAANKYLDESYIPAHNARYAVQAANEVDFHDKVPQSVELNEVFCLEYQRTVSSDWVVRYDNAFLQLRDESVQPGAAVLVRRYGDDSIGLVHEGRKLEFTRLSQPPTKAEKVPQRRAPVSRKPALDHPWRREKIAARK